MVNCFSWIAYLLGRVFCVPWLAIVKLPHSRENTNQFQKEKGNTDFWLADKDPWVVLIGDQSSTLPAAVVSISILFNPFPGRLCGSAPSPWHLPVAAPGRMQALALGMTKFSCWEALTWALQFSFSWTAEGAGQQQLSLIFREVMYGGVIAKRQWED